LIYFNFEAILTVYINTKNIFYIGYGRYTTPVLEPRLMLLM